MTKLVGRLVQVLAFLFLSVVACGQNRELIDSLERNYSDYDPETRVQALYNMATFYRRSDPDKFLETIQKSRGYLTDENPKLRTYALMIEGIALEGEGHLDSAESVFRDAKKTAAITHDNKTLARASAGLGRTLIAAGKAEDAVSNLMEGLRLVDKDPEKEFAIRIRVNLVWAYLELKRYRDGITLGRQSLRLTDSKLEWLALYFYNNMAVCYGAMGLLDSAKYYVEKGIKASEANHDYHALANGYFILGTVYANAGRDDLAIQQYELAIPYREKVGNPLYIVSDLYTLADLYEKTHQYAKGVSTGLEALAVARRHHLLLKFENTYVVLARNYEGLGDFKNAAAYYQLWAVAKDSVYQNANAQAIADMETKYATEKKEQQIALQHVTILAQDANIQRNYILIAALIVSLGLLASIFFLVRSRLQRKQEALKTEYELSVRETFISATIQSQEKERKRFAQDLHDGMGQLISGMRFLMSHQREASKTEEQKAKAEFILDDMHREIRSVAFNLMPQVLIRNGLLPAIQEMASRINETGQLKITVVSFDMPERLLEIQEISLYRVVQEWVNNILKYAHASTVQIQWVAHASEITLTIEDDGNGFDPSILESAVGNGWKNIQSRLHLIKANAEVDSSSNRKGTTFIAGMPLRQ